jgi:hypothetical protein
MRKLSSVGRAEIAAEVHTDFRRSWTDLTLLFATDCVRTTDVARGLSFKESNER